MKFDSFKYASSLDLVAAEVVAKRWQDAQLRPIPHEAQPRDDFYTRIVSDGLACLRGSPPWAKVVIVGAGPAGLCAGYELKRAGFKVEILEASRRVGGRVKTISEPFASPLHGEGGAMRLPADHALVHAYLKQFGMADRLEPFEQKVKFIHLSTFGKTITYEAFNQLLIKKDPDLLSCFPGLKPDEQGKTIDQLWNEAVAPVLNDFMSTYQNNPANIEAAYAMITAKYDKYSLQTYFEEVAGWSRDCITLYDLGSPHVVLDNAFIESFKDAFLSSQAGGQHAGMMQLMGGMREIPMAFLNPSLEFNLMADITYGARAIGADIKHMAGGGQAVYVTYETPTGEIREVTGDFVVFAIPFTALRLMSLGAPFSISKMNAIRELRYVAVTKILLQFKTRWWEALFTEQGQGTHGGVVTDLPIRYTVFPTSACAQHQNGEQRGVIMASYTFQQDATATGALPSDAAVKLAARNLATIFGDSIVYDNLETGTSQVWSADAFSGGSAFAYFAPMQKTKLFPAMVRPEWGNSAHFAGEHVSYSHGWIEGAFESGLRVAADIYDLVVPKKCGSSDNIATLHVRQQVRS